MPGSGLGTVNRYESDSRYAVQQEVVIGMSGSRLQRAVAVLLFWPAGVGMAGEIHGKVTAPGTKSPENIVVYLDAVAGKTYPAPEQHPTVALKNLAFVPHVTVVVKGTTVDFLNDDSALHNVFWPSVSGSKTLGHNIGTWPKGTTKSYTFDHLGSAPLLCNVHPEMSGWVVVVPTPYFGVTDKDGAYAIKNVPPGKYLMRTWSAIGRSTSEDVEVGASSATANVSIPR